MQSRVSGSDKGLRFSRLLLMPSLMANTSPPRTVLKNPIYETLHIETYEISVGRGWGVGNEGMKANMELCLGFRALGNERAKGQCFRE